MRKQILLADNDPDFLDTRAESIRADYQVLKAYTLEEVQRLMADAYFHLAILDIRILDDDDERDISGLTLAKDLRYRSIPKIILTNHPTVQAVRDALGPALDGLPPAVDFVAKKEGPGAMLQAIENAFAQFVRINWELNILWDPRNPLSFPYLVSLLQPNLGNDILIDRANELEDLLRKVFYEYQQVRFGQLLWHNYGQFCISVLAQTANKTTDFRILVCGAREFLEHEWTQIKRLAPDTIQGTELRGYAETIHFGANLYGLSGVAVETVQTLRDLLQMGKERPLKMAFTHLLGEVLKRWHQHGQVIEEKQDLMSIYGQWAGLADDNVSRSQLEQRVDALIQSVRTLGATEIKRENQQITFQLPRQSPRSFPDPIVVISIPLTQYAPVVCSISPGRLKAENVLVDPEQRTWLTDFANAGQSPQWWDFICLEADIRFDVSQAPDILAWQDFEECLVKPNQLDEHLDQSDVIPDLRTSISLIEQIRQQAASETGVDPVPYYAGLLIWVMEVISHYDPDALSTQADKLRNAHLLLAASMLAERLNQGIAPDAHPIDGELKLDSDDKIWIGNRYIATFSGLRLKLFRCLYEQAGQSVSTRTIVEKVYGEKYDPGDRDQNQRIRQEISRIREAVEPKPNQPRYILTIREKGYRLQVNGDAENTLQ